MPKLNYVPLVRKPKQVIFLPTRNQTASIWWRSATPVTGMLQMSCCLWQRWYVIFLKSLAIYPFCHSGMRMHWLGDKSLLLCHYARHPYYSYWYNVMRKCDWENTYFHVFMYAGLVVWSQKRKCPRLLYQTAFFFNPATITNMFSAWIISHHAKGAKGILIIIPFNVMTCGWFSSAVWPQSRSLYVTNVVYIHFPGTAAGVNAIFTMMITSAGPPYSFHAEINKQAVM